MTRSAKGATSQSSLLRSDLLFLVIFIILGMGFANFLTNANSPFIEQVEIRTSIDALPSYALLSFTRSIIALFLSYTFAILYGALAANNKTLERILIPLLDVLQSLPVLAFLPGFVLSLISVFQNSRWGLEISCILTIFVGQVWNLAFAYYESLRTLQPEFKEVTTVYPLSMVQKFFFLYLPNGYRPLIYNGMMSMAGGWFFLTTCEAFILGNKSFRLPGLGSYLAVTFAEGHQFNFLMGICVLLLIIVGTDFLLWKPLTAWVSRFREGDDGKTPVETSFFLNIINTTNIPSLISEGFKWAVLFLFPKSGVQEKGAMRKYLISKIDGASSFFTPTYWITLNRIQSIRRSPIIPFIATFAVGGAVFSLLPKLPDLGHSMATLSNNDWFELIHAVFLTGLKVLAVLVISSLWTIPFGLWLGLNPRLERLAQPIIQNLAAFPAPVLFPLIAMMLVKAQLPSFLNTTLLMCVGCQWYILFNVIGGASRISSELKLVAKIYRFSLWNRFRKLYFPAILPSLSTGWITAAGGGWNASIVAEVVNYPGGIMKSDGIGAELAYSSSTGNYARLAAAIICIVVVVLMLNRTVWHTLQLYSERVKD